VEGCARCDALEARLAKAEALVRQLLAQTNLAMGNQAVAKAALENFLEPSPLSIVS
jgi:hypothetical protein